MPLCREETFQVVYDECDAWDRMTPGAVLRRTQQIATMQCEAFGVDPAFYARTHTAFVLSRLSLEVYRMPRPNDRVRIETRAYGMRRAVYHRVTSLHAENGEKLCETDGRWVLIDTVAKRIVRKPLEAFEPHFNDVPGAEEHEINMPKVKREDTEKLSEQRAVFSLCDRNGHVNNTRYADLVCDLLPLEALRAGAPKKMLFSYHSEIPMAQPFALYGASPQQDGYYYAAWIDEAKCFEAHVTF